jgi:hypothetical protein
LGCADDVNPLVDNIVAVKKHSKTLIDASKQVGPVVAADKTK